MSYLRYLCLRTVVFNTYCVAFFLFCLPSSCVLCMMVSNTYYVVFLVLSSSCVLRMVVSNTHCVVFFLFFLVFVLCLVYGGRNTLCCVLCFVCLRFVSCVRWCPTHMCCMFFVGFFVFVLCLVYGDLQCILCWVFLGFFCHCDLCTLCFQFLWIVHFWMTLMFL